MRGKKKKENNNATYCQRYRQKIQLKRLQSKRFDKNYRKYTAARQALYRTKKKQQQEQQAIQPTSTITVSKSDLRKGEGIQRRRQNTKKFKLEINKLQNSNKQLQMENKKLKEQLICLTSSSSSSSSSTTTTTLSSSSKQSNADSTTTISPSTLFFQNLSPNAKRHAKARMVAQNSDLPRGSNSSIRNKFGINVSCGLLYPSSII
ncbi:unnamed protein product [Rotaria sp. Silwood1]|nr:unnamed protein product [Rotaria sp. Silwood1]CAF1684162.1 unnamed protein product [Rotaria sp. Silwood1]CAF3851457.1 unnamed protein product [Rotaria sp. Silwood1]CAF3923070.1 unnamed protein product [Rotaria sp. Silwood1]CAF5024226.1 unnamed protein product [Rotaria sp. Silwood1]